MSEPDFSESALKWIEKLKDKGYEHHAKTMKDLELRSWLKPAFDKIGIKENTMPGLKVFEFGCGGARNLVPLAVRGCKCLGIDCSKEVLERAKNYIKEAEILTGKKLDIILLEGDALNYELKESEAFDLVLQVGVMEHFFDEAKRNAFLSKMAGLTKNGGFVVSVLPNGIHKLRKEMKERKLGGYCIEEIDYSPELVKGEMERAGLKDVKVFGSNLFAYLMLKKNNIFLLERALRGLLQLIPLSILPEKFVFQHTVLLIGIGKKQTLDF